MHSYSHCSQWSQSLESLRSLRVAAIRSDIVAMTSAISSCEPDHEFLILFFWEIPAAQDGSRLRYPFNMYIVYVL